MGNPIVGNPSLIPEKSKGFSIGFNQPFLSDRVKWSVNVFYNKYFDIIDFDTGPPPQLVNRDEVTAKGFESSLVMPITNDLSVHAHITYVNTDLANSNQELRHRPEWSGGMNIIWNALKELRFTLNILYIGKVYDSSIPTDDVELEPYSRVDATITWELSKYLSLGLGVDNLFNTRYEEVVGFPALGIRPRLWMRSEF